MSASMANQDKNYISVGSWVLMRVLLVIPVVNLVMLVVWAIDRENETRRNFALASFILMAIGFAIALLFFAIFGLAFAGMSHAAQTH